MWKDNPIRKFISRKKLNIKFGVLASMIVFAYMFFANGEALWQNYQINQEIAKLKVEIVQLGNENLQFKNLIAYLKTESFREKEARRKLGYKKPGEQVVAIPQDNFIHTDPGNTKTEPAPEDQPQLSNPQKWWDYILG
ncbi:MAG: septum formation initiator family protein [Patescibacteria group bacterium]|jgi:cell division protein FtsB